MGALTETSLPTLPGAQETRIKSARGKEIAFDIIEIF
jgi:hypothetical protein